MEVKKSGFLRIISLVLTTAVLCQFAYGKVIYVDDDAGGANDGSSWAAAYCFLQNALADAQSGDEIRVAQGIYKPDLKEIITARGAGVIRSGDRTDTFQLINGVAIKGGYAGLGEPNPDARDVEVYETVLSGDLKGDDRPNFTNNSENSYHIVTSSGTNATSVLDGFTVKGGNANGPVPYDRGSGMYNGRSSPTVINCMFTGNWGDSGGAMNNDNSTPAITNCTFSGNSADKGGGAMNNWQSSPILTNCTFINNSAGWGGGAIDNVSWDEYTESSPTVINCTFTGNSAGWDGGGMSNVSSHPALTNCTFSENSAESGGGGVHNDAGRPTLLNCTFSGNSSMSGGGMYNESGSGPVVTNCTFKENSAKAGGGMRNNNSSPTVINCTFRRNSASNNGGGIHNYDSQSNITNCIFSGNSAKNGGGMRNGIDSRPTVTNCTFSENSSEYGGGMYNNSSSSPTVNNCTFSSNSAFSGGAIYDDGSSLNVINCILWGDTPEEIYGGRPVITYSDVQGGWPGEGNIDSDPLFVNAAHADYHLQAGSPCINAGDNSAIPQSIIVDLDENSRIVNGIVDMGAYEGRTVQAAIINVPADLPTIQDGINAAKNGDTVLVSPGTYVENINFNGKDIIVGSLMLTTGDASYIDQTVIDGNQNGSVVTFESGEDSTAILNGFTIINGSGTWIHGGGIFLDNNSCPILINLIVTGNVAYAANGAGICCLNNSNCRIENVIVTGNDGLGSAQYTYDPNGTNDGTGGVYLGHSSPTLRNVVIANNTGLLAGGMFCNSNSNPALINVTIAGNTAIPRGYYNETAEIITWGNSNPVLTNTIIWNDSLVEIILRDNAITISYSDVQGGLNGIVTHDDATVNWLDGNIDSDPMFVDPVNMDYRLQAGSPCIDAGDNSVIPQSRFGVTDLDGNPRIANGTVDMGAYEGRIVQPKTAYNPNPTNGAEYVYPNIELSWSPGDGAQLHIVYFGDNFNDVNIETGGIFQETTTYTPGPLEWSKTYYWRVDEFDGAVIHKGEVWNFRTMPDIDSNLIGWWKFDEGSGNIAYDSSGHSNDGSFNGNPQWVSGHSGYALEFDGSGDWLDCGEDPSLQITEAVTVAVWIKVSAQGIDHKIGGNQDGVNGGYKMTIYSNNRVEFEIRTASNRAILNRNVSGGTEIEVGVWYHVTGVYSLEDGYIRTYVNGFPDREMSTTDALGASLGPFRIGCEPFETSFRHHHFNGVMDDLRIYNRALTEGEVLVAMEEGGEGRSYAFNPKPADGAKYVSGNVELSWSPGSGAQLHIVYFGDNFDDVNNDAGGILLETTTYIPGPLELDKVYYWRVDEFDGAVIHKGDIWSFTVIHLQ